jgi:hypothetical protein
MDMNQVGAELLEVIKKGIVAGGEAITTQLPILCKQILQWGIVSNIFTIILSVFMMILGYKLTMFGIKKGKEDDYSGELWAFLYIPAIMVIIAFLVMFWASIFEIGKILSAPNVYILDYFKSLVTSK